MVLYFTGTGNSRYLARRIAEGLEMPLYDLNACIKAGDTAPVQTGRDVVLVTPTYAWRIPRVVSEWLGKTELTGAERIWFVMDCGSEIGNAAGYNRKLAAQKQLQYMGTAQIIMPENYIAMFNAPRKEQARSIVEPVSYTHLKVQGTGLGMAIARNIVNLMNGDIQVESAPNKGTKITVTV